MNHSLSLLLNFSSDEWGLYDNLKFCYWMKFYVVETTLQLCVPEYTLTYWRLHFVRGGTNIERKKLYRVKRKPQDYPYETLQSVSFAPPFLHAITKLFLFLLSFVKFFSSMRFFFHSNKNICRNINICEHEEDE